MKFLSDPHVQVLAALVVSTGLFAYVVRRTLSHMAGKAEKNAPRETRVLWLELLRAAWAPLSLLIWYYGLYATVRFAIGYGWIPGDWRWLGDALHQVAGIGVFAAVVWFFFRAARVAETHLKTAAMHTAGRLDDIFLPLLGTGLRLLVPILALLLMVRFWPLSELGADVVEKLLAITLIGAATWLIRKAIVLTEAAVVSADTLLGTDFSARARATRVGMLRKIATVFLTIFAFAAVLMLFPQVRHIGQSIFASAGIAGIVLGFAAQKTLGNLLAGIQIAFTQPIRIGDLVSVEGEVGNIEEITLTYVIVRIWDLRRLVLPISYFIDKPFQNWTRASVNMLSPVPLRFDFSLPIEPFRAYMKSVVERSSYWDKKVFSVQVTSADATSMEVRILGSAADAGASGNLQAEVREKAIEFVQKNYPECLPKGRREWKTVEPHRVAPTDGHTPPTLPPRRAASA